MRIFEIGLNKTESMGKERIPQGGKRMDKRKNEKTHTTPRNLSPQSSEAALGAEKTRKKRAKNLARS